MRIKICGMSEQCLIDEAAALGVEFCGFVFHEPSVRNVAPSLVASLDTHGMKRVGVFVRQSADEIRQIADEAGLDFIQLHGGQSAEFAGQFPAERIIRVLWPSRYESLAALQRDIDAFAGSCGMYLLDAGMGSGRELDWSRLGPLSFPHPWFLSGGLGPENVARALSLCSPDGLDFNSKLESSPGRKSGERMEKAVAAVRDREDFGRSGACAADRQKGDRV